MPGLLQYQTSVAGASNATHPPSASSLHPENFDLSLPSNIPAAHRTRVCLAELPNIEEQLRTAQCHDALESIRHILKRDGTRSRTVIDRVHNRAKAAAIKYRAARQAKLDLSGPGEWEAELQPLADADDNQIETMTSTAAMDVDEEQSNIDLLMETRERRDGTGETRRTLSWIWTSTSRTPDPADETDDILRSEWAKSRSRVNRSTEEVLLLKEEMRRTLEFLEWKAKWWIGRPSLRTGLSKELAEGLNVYALNQASLQRSLAQEFRALWITP
ncbi:hypothetical protein BJ912DRAFT_844731 [Pholiota molesta]|nr:hypothetical protein BJ912DRAFT_844731 [Pholiota molesta]